MSNIDKMLSDIDAMTLESEPNCTPQSIWIHVEKRTQSTVAGTSILVPNMTSTARATYHVVSLGSDVKLKLEPGQQVILSPDTWAVPVTEDTRKYYLVKEECICGVLK